MRTHRHRLLSAAALAAAGALLLAGCGGETEEGAAPEVDTEAPVTIGVSNKPTSESPEELASFERRLAEFGTEHPNITVEAEETVFEPDTFQALLAGGQLPTVFLVPFTEMQGLIARQQVADVTDYLTDYDTLGNINPSVNAVTQAQDRTYGVPTGAYTMGLIYNRSLFEEAGLDPDSPPATWEEVREAARAIEDGTDAQGYATMATENGGGWTLTTASYGHGGLLESEDGTQATIENEATREVLQMYRQMRFEDDVFGDNFLLSYEDINNSFAAGQIGMYVQGADQYSEMVINKGMDAEDFGVGPLPQTEDGIGTLGGGTAAIVAPDASPEEIAAAVEWIDFYHYERFSDEQVAVADAQASAEDGLAVGAPALPLLDQEADDRYLGWIAEEVNVPRDNFTAYLESTQTLPLVPEPPVKAQELYATLDPVVQAVLTREDADIDALLAEAQSTVQSAIELG